MTMPEIATEIGSAIGYTFQEDKREDWEGHWYFKVKGIRCEIHKDKYSEGCKPKSNHTEDGSFISASISFNMGGSSGPMDSLDEAIRFFKKKIPIYLGYVRR